MKKPEFNEDRKNKAAEALAVLRRVADEFNPSTVANSYGLEDMVLMDMICRHDLPLTMFSLDTGRLPAETYDLMAKAEAHYSRKVDVYYPNTQAIEQFVRKEGINAFYDSVDLRKSCCGIRKVEPLGRALTGQKAWVVGLRREQAPTRAELPVQEHDDGHGIEKFSPLADWSLNDTWAYIHAHEVPYNALHDQGFPSIGCAPCTRAVAVGEDIRAGRWWWENPDSKECGLHVK